MNQILNRHETHDGDTFIIVGLILRELVQLKESRGGDGGSRSVSFVVRGHGVKVPLGHVVGRNIIDPAQNIDEEKLNAGLA